VKNKQLDDDAQDAIM